MGRWLPVMGKVMNWLYHDHKHFEAIVYECRSACDDENWGVAQRLLDELTGKYESHVRVEEHVLFPAYEALAGVSTTPTKSLKNDHTQIFSLMAQIAQRLGQGTCADLAEEFALLYRTLTRHHEKEEEIFLPMASELLSSGKHAILDELNNLQPQTGSLG